MVVWMVYYLEEIVASEMEIYLVAYWVDQKDLNLFDYLDLQMVENQALIQVSMTVMHWVFLKDFGKVYKQVHYQAVESADKMVQSMDEAKASVLEEKVDDEQVLSKAEMMVDMMVVQTA